MEFGTFIKVRRNYIPYSSKQVGEIVGCSASFISGIERNEQYPSTAMACKILDALNVEYAKVNPLTLQVIDGPTFRFKSSVRGQNRERRNVPTNNDLENRITLLENKISSLETVIINILSNTMKEEQKNGR